jgi:hypothetical protein
MKADEAALLDNDIPALTDGIYELRLTETISVSGTTKSSTDHVRTFTIRGPQFELAPQEIVSFYPPSSTHGDYGNVLPHIALTRSSLPWERLPSADSSSDPNERRPWLAVVLVHEDDTRPDKNGKTAAAVRQIKLSDLSKTHADDKSVHFPLPFTPDGSKADRVVRVLDVDSEFADEWLPTWRELKACCCVRIGASGTQAVAAAHSRRRPSAGITRAHLLSLEAWYDARKLLPLPAGKTRRRFVSLFDWPFVSDPVAKAKRSFASLSEGLDVGLLQMPGQPSAKDAHAKYLHDLGAVAVPSFRRSGLTRAAVYHGPFAPYKDAKTHAAAEGVMLRPVRTMVFGAFEDVSYPAAYELGRLMLLHDPAASRRLYNWKVGQEQQSRSCDGEDHLPFARAAHNHPFPVEWFRRLIDLESVPFAYLVPRQDMLPPETGRLFDVATSWLRKLIDGALSVVWVGKGDERNAALRKILDEKREALFKNIPERSGLLIRSALMSDWPNLTVQTEPDQAKLTSRKLSRDVGLYLFENATKLTFSVPAEHLHFEWNPSGSDPTTAAEFAERFVARKDRLELAL